MAKCPGQDQRYWKPDDIFEANCPNCSTVIEFWKDEPRRKCRQCQETVWNPKIDIGCGQWCQDAEQCFGMTDGEDIICQKLIAEMKSIFGPDRTRMGHNLTILRFADELQKAEGGNPLVIKSAAVLHDVEGPETVRDILGKHDIDAESVDHICCIITNYIGDKEIGTIESGIISDATWLAKLAEEVREDVKEQLFEKMENAFKTKAAKQLGQKLIVKKNTK